MTTPSADLRQENRRRLISYFESGVKPSGYPATLGLELEHFVVTRSGAPVTYDGDPGIRDLLAELVESGAYPHPLYTDEGQLIGAAGSDGVISLEPAAQVEISLAPFGHIAQVEAAYQRFYHTVNAILDRYDARLVAAGYHPTRRAEELALIPKDRYHFMDAYFGDLGTHGLRMMRATASTQVSVDYTSEADAVRKLRIASAIAPLLAAFTSNTAVFEGHSATSPLTRLAVWRDVDPARCGQIPGLYDPDFGFGRYADWLLGLSPIFVTRPAASDPHGPAVHSCPAISACDAYADAPLTHHDIEHLISMVWPDVRLKRYVEIRPADSLPAPQAMGYTALIKGIMYSPQTLDLVEKTLGVTSSGHWPLDAQSTERAIAAIQRDRDQAIVHGVPYKHWHDLLFEASAQALDASERPYLEPLRTWDPWASNA